MLSVATETLRGWTRGVLKPGLMCSYHLQESRALPETQGIQRRHSRAGVPRDRLQSPVKSEATEAEGDRK